MTDTSGDLLADRRYAYGAAALEEGDPEAAADLARQALEIAPGFAPAWFLLGLAREAQWREHGSGAEGSAAFREAGDAFQSARALDPEDRQGAALRLAALGIGDPAAAMTPAYLRRLFDDYAIRFDRQLVRSLHYRAPELLLDAVRRTRGGAPGPLRFRVALDLGCGTGLCGAAFRPLCETLAGVDLSPAMVERARRKDLYDELAVGDLVGWLATRPPGAADLVLAADVLVYVGELGPVFAAVARALAPGGLFAFTVQAGGTGAADESAGFAIGDDLRFAHRELYLRRLATEQNLDVAWLEAVSTRQDRGIDVAGLLLVLKRPARQP